MKLDILVIAAHPDDAELGCGGTIAKHVAAGKKVGILDLTKGELGTRGNDITRKEEAEASSAILGISVRENAGLPDGFFQNTIAERKVIIHYVRKYQPDIVITNAPTDRHPDHGRAANLVYDACFLSGLVKIETINEMKSQAPWRPISFYHFIQSAYLKPDFVVDITDYWNIKMEAIKAFKTQFHTGKEDGPQTFISRPEFINFLEARAIELGNICGVKYAEGFITKRYPVINLLTDIT
jgi:bacillithiol biosynthesis deacetylase BshB1